MAEKKEKRYVSDNAQLMAEWDWDKNIELDLSPFVLTCGSNKYAWWKCEKGHSYEARIYNRNKGHGCPYCSGRKITHENSLAFSRPDLLKEWNYSKNSNLDPYTIGKSVSKKVWWICPKGHEWQATVNSRRYGVGCPICAKDAQTSFSEQVIFFYAKKFFLNAKNRAIINDCELDIYIPELSLGIEYDGYFWHKNKNVEDNRKSIKLQKSGIRLIRKKDYIPNAPLPQNAPKST